MQPARGLAAASAPPILAGGPCCLTAACTPARHFKCATDENAFSESTSQRALREVYTFAMAPTQKATSPLAVKRPLLNESRFAGQSPCVLPRPTACLLIRVCRAPASSRWACSGLHAQPCRTTASERGLLRPCAGPCACSCAQDTQRVHYSSTSLRPMPH